MPPIIDSPFIILLIFFVAQWWPAYLGDLFRRTVRSLDAHEREDFNIVLTATLTLLGLIIGFSFSMAVSRYDQRKGYEEAEANAIGTEFVRADLLPAEDATRVRELLKQYANQRIAFYLGRGEPNVEAKLQSELWSAVADATRSQPTPVGALAASGMNDVLNSQGYTGRRERAWGVCLAPR